MQIVFGQHSPRRDFQIGVDTSPVAYGGLPSFHYSGQVYSYPHMHSVCNPFYGALGVYYNVGMGHHPGGGYLRVPGVMGPFGWCPAHSAAIPRGMNAVGSMGAAVSVMNNPRSRRELSRRLMHRTLNRYRGPHRRGRADSGRHGGGGKGVDAPPNINDRANVYFDKMVAADDPAEGGKVFNYDSKKSIREAEKDEAKKNPDVKGREAALTGLVQTIHEGLRGDNAQVKRGEFLEQVKEWEKKGVLDDEKRLLSLVAPGAAKVGDIPNGVMQRLYQQLGSNRQPPQDSSNAENIFKAYHKMLRDRFGGSYSGIVRNLFSKARALASGLPSKKVEGMSPEKIESRGFTPEEAKVIYEKAFQGKSVLDQRRLFGKSFPDLSGEGDPETKAYNQKKVQKIGAWYLQEVKGMTDSDEMNKKFNEALSVNSPVTITVNEAVKSYEKKLKKDLKKRNAQATPAQITQAVNEFKKKLRDLKVGETHQGLKKLASGKLQPMKGGKPMSGKKPKWDVVHVLNRLDELVANPS